MEVSKRLRKAREELAVADEQLSALSEAADEARYPLARLRDAVGGPGEPGSPQRHAEAMAGARTASRRRSSGWKPSSTSCSTSWSPARRLVSAAAAAASFSGRSGRKRA